MRPLSLEMSRPTLLSSATVRVAVFALAALALAPPCAGAYTPPLAHVGSEDTPLNLGSSASTGHTSSGGTSIVRTIVGLAIVIAVIWGLSWVLRQVKARRDPRAVGGGLASLATLPLGSGRSLHLVRAGNDYVLIGIAEHGVTPIHRYSEQQAREAGLLGQEDSAAFPQAPERGERGAPQPIGEPGSHPLDRLREWTVRR